MPNIKSAIKDLRKSARRKVFNIHSKKKYRGALKETRGLISAGTKEQAMASLPNAMKQLDKAAKRKVIHKNTASRIKSRIAQAINKL